MKNKYNSKEECINCSAPISKHELLCGYCGGENKFYEKDISKSKKSSLFTNFWNEGYLSFLASGGST